MERNLGMVVAEKAIVAIATEVATKDVSGLPRDLMMVDAMRKPIWAPVAAKRTAWVEWAAKAGGNGDGGLLTRGEVYVKLSLLAPEMLKFAYLLPGFSHL
jgi:hypothetical protein